MDLKDYELIKKYEKPGDFNYATVTDEMLKTAEKKLSINLPDQYKDYLKMFGHGGIGGIEIQGVGLTGRMIFADSTEEYRKDGLPNNLVVIENDDEWLICIDCNNGKIVSWDYEGCVKEEYDCFDSFLHYRLLEAIDNM
jgi:hypothetical protein